MYESSVYAGFCHSQNVIPSTCFHVSLWPAASPCNALHVGISLAAAACYASGLHNSHEHTHTPPPPRRYLPLQYHSGPLWGDTFPPEAAWDSLPCVLPLGKLCNNFSGSYSLLLNSSGPPTTWATFYTHLGLSKRPFLTPFLQHSPAQLQPAVKQLTSISAPSELRGTPLP